MKKIRNFIANIKPIWALRGTVVIITLLGLITLFHSHPHSFLAWLMGILNGVTVTLIWVAYEENDDD